MKTDNIINSLNNLIFKLNEDFDILLEKNKNTSKINELSKSIENYYIFLSNLYEKYEKWKTDYKKDDIEKFLEELCKKHIKRESNGDKKIELKSIDKDKFKNIFKSFIKIYDEKEKPNENNTDKNGDSKYSFNEIIEKYKKDSSTNILSNNNSILDENAIKKIKSMGITWDDFDTRFNIIIEKLENTLKN